MKWIARIVVVVIVLLVLFLALAPGQIESSMNRVLEHPRPAISSEAQALHDSLVVGDLHADSTLWAACFRVPTVRRTPEGSDACPTPSTTTSWA